ncbi:LacI family transcriptional regulator [Paenibacillus endophyticus]|uniref:LacI family transcriptional regulator n=1 Tax=Paenibacillus endophyticus TaxID=1294268 RepID=A0A7W5CEK4_9BACL|nr:LacI family DNA-binding transcriptional regulator [Paenibacillus endophyticus]MBB3156246.1 LacI family transcriptional regulator [Paenibacillus endophyticus]
MRRKVTIQSIADYTGLSKFAVSRGLSGKSGVSPQTRELILRAAGQLGFFKDTQAAPVPKELLDIESRSWSGTILVLFPNVRYQNTDSLYWGPIFNGISLRLNQKGMNILTLTEPTDDSMFSLLNPEAIMGIITVGSISTPVLLDIKRLGIPVVMVDHYDPKFYCDSIFTDNLSSMREIMSSVISKGYKSYQFIGNIRDAQSFYERYLGFRSSLEDHDIELKQIPSLKGPEIDTFHDTFKAAVLEHGLPEVFVCANDTFALFALDTLRDMGMEIPENLVFTGFDNTHPQIPFLATVNVDKELLGKRAVDQMLWRLLNPATSYEKILIQAEVMVRN